MIVELNANEVLVATYIGSRRNAEASFRGRKPRFPEKNVGELWGFHIESAHAELAVCKYLGIYWGFGVNTFHVEDVVNTDLEIRWSSREDVKVRPDDKGIVVSVTGQCPNYEIKGWIRASDAKQDKWKYTKTLPVCYFVPHTELKPIEDLKCQMK
jgi:hypothetical protein